MAPKSMVIKSMEYPNAWNAANVARHPVPYKPSTSKFFMPSTFLRSPSLGLLAGIIGTVGGAAAAFMVYCLVTKPDVRVKKWKKYQDHEYVDPTRCYKLMNLSPEQYRPIPEVEQLKKELGPLTYHQG